MTYLSIFLLITIMFSTPAQKQIINKKISFIKIKDNKYQTKSLSGLYYAVDYKMSGIDSGRRNDVFFIFYPDGRFFQGSACEGMEAFDPSNANVKGYYEVKDNLVYIQLIPNHELRIDQNIFSTPIAEDGSLTFYGRQYTPLANCTGITLNGVYGRKWNDIYIERRMILFTPDGRFQDTGVLPQTGLLFSYKYRYSTPRWSDEYPITGTGKYGIRNNTLYLAYDNGMVETVQIYIRPEHAAKVPSQIILGDYEFELKQLK